jgi:vancomycin resistance protein VanJ
MMRIVRWVAVGYTVLIVIWFGLWLTVKDAWWGTALLNRIVPQLFLPAPFIGAAALMSGNRKLALAGMLPLIIFSGLFWPYLLPRPAGKEPANNALRVMTFNVLYSNTNYDSVANVVLKYQPDLIAFQEVQPAMMEALKERLGKTYPYSFINAEHPYGTTAAFSRFPVNEAYSIDLEGYHAPRTLVRPAAVLNVEVAGRTITFVATHLLAYGLQWVVQDDILKVPAAVTGNVIDHEGQAALLVNEVMSHTGIGIVACDCNSPETSGPYRVLANAMTNSALEAGWLLDGSAPDNVRADIEIDHIDYVFHRGPWTATNLYVIKDFAGSDHLPVLAVLQWNE